MAQFTVLSVTSTSIVGETKEGTHKIFELKDYPNLSAAKKGDVIEDVDNSVSLESKTPAQARAPSAGRGSTKSTTNKELM